MRESQKARKALTAPDVLFNLAYWETVKEQILKDLLELIEEKAKRATKPHKNDLLGMDPEQARKMMYWANQYAQEVNTLYTVRLFMDTLMDACYISLQALNEQYLLNLSSWKNEAKFWRELHDGAAERDLSMTELALKYVTAFQKNLKRQSNP